LAKGFNCGGASTRSFSGASLDQSYQLEPSQVAGFVQSYRSIIPESIAGAMRAVTSSPVGSRLGFLGAMESHEIFANVAGNVIDFEGAGA